jgi:hypothetical protein
MTNKGRNTARTVFPIPPCPSLDDPMSLEDVRAVAELAYEWGWPLVNVATRAKRAQQVADGQPHLVDGIPLAYNSFALQTEAPDPNERVICCPNSGLLYGGGMFHLGTKGVVFQVPPDLCNTDTFWLYSLYDARTNQFGAIGKQYASGPGFYLIVGPDWDNINPEPGTFKDAHLIKSTTDLAFTVARVFLKPPDLPSWLDLVDFYPAEQYQPGIYQPRKPVTGLSCPIPIRRQEMRFVHPLTFFDQLPDILDSVKAQCDQEKELYCCFRKLLKLADENPRVMRICRSVARETETTTIQNYMQWSQNGVEAGNGWYRSVDSAQWTLAEYRYRTATAKSNLFQNRPEDTRYYCTDNETNNVGNGTNGPPLDGQNTYVIEFDGGLPPAKGPWSVTVYNQFHFLYASPYSVSGTDRCLGGSNPAVIYAGPRHMGDGCWIQTPPNEPFSLYLRAYGMDDNAVSTWMPPTVRKHQAP